MKSILKKGRILLDNEKYTGYLFILPNFILFAVFFIYPFFSVWAYSLTDWNLFSTRSFAGFSNYVRVFFEDDLFLKVMWNTIYYSFVAVLSAVFLAFWLALLMNRKILGRLSFRLIYFLPFYDGEWIPSIPFTRTLIEQGESPVAAKYWRSKELNKMVRELQPQIVINNRSGLDEDVDTPERYVVPSKKGRAWESNITTGDGWGYLEYEPKIKLVHLLIEHLVTCAGNGGNFLLNVGPKPDGTIQEEFVVRLREIGEWMKKNGESIYGSERVPSGFAVGALGAWWTPLGSVTAKGNVAYIHILRWPSRESATLTGIKNRVLGARILATGEKIAFEKTNNGKLFLKGLPQNSPDPYDTVIALELEGKPEPFDYSGIPL